MSDEVRMSGGVAATVSIVTTQSDRDRAADYPARLTPLLEQAAAIMNEANTEGLQVGFNIARDNMGRNRVMDIQVFRPL